MSFSDVDSPFLMSIDSITSLAQLSTLLRSLPNLRAEAMREASDGVYRLLHQQFDAGVDSYGKPWAPLAPRTLNKGRRPPPLTDTGMMRASIDVRSSADGLHISVSTPAEYHQSGTAHMPARKILPEVGLPPSWERVIQDAITRAEQRIGGK